MVLLYADGRKSKEVAARSAVNGHMVRRWRRRFARAGVEGLTDEYRAGMSPPKTSADTSDFPKRAANVRGSRPPPSRSRLPASIVRLSISICASSERELSTPKKPRHFFEPSQRICLPRPLTIGANEFLRGIMAEFAKASTGDSDVDMRITQS